MEDNGLGYHVSFREEDNQVVFLSKHILTFIDSEKEKVEVTLLSTFDAESYLT